MRVEKRRFFVCGGSEAVVVKEVRQDAVCARRRPWPRDNEGQRRNACPRAEGECDLFRHAVISGLRERARARGGSGLRRRG